ncbi:MAG: hypothetical protein AB7Y46_11865 [Armatimonadota bacterium]
MIGQRFAAVVLVLAAITGLVMGVRAQPAPGQRPGYEIAWATFVGGSAWDQLREVIPFPDGSVLVAGLIKSAGLPTTAGAVQGEYAGDDPALGHGGIYGGDAYLLRLSADGTKRVAATYFGGSKQERGVYGMDLDAAGRIVIAGATRSPDLPTTEGAYQQRYGGGRSDVFAARLSADMTELEWCTYVGGSGEDWPRGGLALGPHGEVVIVGNDDSPNFVTTPGALEGAGGAAGDAMVLTLSADGAQLLMAARVGGSASDGVMGARVGPGGAIYLGGHTQSPDLSVTPNTPQPLYASKSDCWLACLAPDGSRLVYSTYLGGSENEFAEHRPWLGTDGSLLLTGVTQSPDFPTTPGAVQRSLRGRNDGFLVKLAPGGDRLEFCTLLGGSEGEFFLMPTPDPDGNILIVGQTSSIDFPVTPDALQPRYGGGPSDGVLALLSPDGSRVLYASYLGGSGEDMVRSTALGGEGTIWLVGSTSSRDFPVSAAVVQPDLGGDVDGFVVKLVPTR